MKSLNKFTLWNSIIQLLWIKSKGKSGKQPEKTALLLKELSYEWKEIFYQKSWGPKEVA